MKLRIHVRRSGRIDVIERNYAYALELPPEIALLVRAGRLHETAQSRFLSTTAEALSELYRAAGRETVIEIET